MAEVADQMNTQAAASSSSRAEQPAGPKRCSATSTGRNTGRNQQAKTLEQLQHHLEDLNDHHQLPWWDEDEVADAQRHRPSTSRFTSTSGASRRRAAITTGTHERSAKDSTSQGRTVSV